MFNRLKAALIAVTTILASFACCFGISADSSLPRSFIFPDSRVISAAADIITDDFNRATVVWSVSGGTAEAAASLPEYPYSSFEGSRCLSVISKGERISVSLSANDMENVPSASDLAYYSGVVYIPYEADGAVLTLELSAKHGSFKSDISLTGGTWQLFDFDLKDASLSGNITSVKLTVNGLAKDQRVLFDLIGGSTDSEYANKVRFMSGSYTNELGIKTEKMSISLSGDNSYIETDSPVINDFSGGTGIRLRLQNSSNCRSVTLSYTTPLSPEYDSKNSVTRSIPDGEGIVSCMFPMPDSYIMSYRITFNGYCSGDVDIVSVTPCACYSPAVSIGTVGECTIRSDKRYISLSGQINESELSKYADCPIYLYELDYIDSANSVTPQIKPFAETVLNGNSFSFAFPISDSRKELYKKYAVMAYYEGTLVPIGTPRAVSNPELIAEQRESFETKSVKGVYPAAEYTVLDGIGVTAVEVSLDELFDRSAANTLKYTCGGDNYSLDGDYVSELDKTIKGYEDAGTGVYIILTVRRSDDISLNEMLTYSGSSGNGRVAFSTSNEGVKALRCAGEFITARYAARGTVSENLCGVTVGYNVNDCIGNYDMGQTSFRNFTLSYCAVFRTVYNSVKSICSGVDVYISLGGIWESGMAATQTGTFDASAVLNSVATCLSYGGNIDFGVSYDIFRHENGYYAYSDVSPDISSEARYITAANLEVLTTYLSKDELLYGGSARKVILLEADRHDSTDLNDEINLSADYIFTYLRISCRAFSSVKAFIPAHDASYENTLSLVDTQHLSELTDSYFSELIGKERCDMLIRSATSAVARYTQTKRLLTAPPSEVKGKTTLFSFGTSDCGWRKSAGCDEMRIGATLGKRSELMSVRIGSENSGIGGVMCKFDTNYDFSIAPYISLSVHAASLNVGTESINVYVVLFSGNSYCMFEAEIKGGKWNDLVCDLRDFPRASACDGMAVYLSSGDGSNIGQPTLLLGPISAMSSEYSGEDIANKIKVTVDDQNEKTVTVTTIIIISAIIVSSAVILTVRVVRRHRKKEDDDIEILQ